jgi:hypothetical protein
MCAIQEIIIENKNKISCPYIWARERSEGVIRKGKLNF